MVEEYFTPNHSGLLGEGAHNYFLIQFDFKAILLIRSYNVNG